MGRLHFADADGMVAVTPSVPQIDTPNSPTALSDNESLPNTLFHSQLNANIGANNLYLWPFFVSSPILISHYTFRLTANSQATSTDVRCGVYQKNPDWSSDGLLTEFTTTSVPATTTGVFTTSVGTPYRLPVGDYYVAWTPTATLQFRVPRATAPSFRFSQANCSLARVRQSGITSANPLPATLTYPLVFDTDATTWGPATLLHWTNE